MDAIVLDNVTKRRGDFYVKQLDLTIKRGYITGLIGPNGSGKTSLISMIMGLMQPEHGQVSVLGRANYLPETKQQIGFVYDDLYMYDNYTIEKMHKVIAPLYENWNETLFQQYIQTFKLPYKKKLKHLSKGMRMKCSFLFAISHEPQLLIMDEPTAGLDPVFRREMLQIIQEFMIGEEQTVLFATHITSDLDKVADEIIFLDDAAVTTQQSTEALREYYHLVKGSVELLDEDIRSLFIGLEESAIGFIGLYKGPQSFYRCHGHGRYRESNIRGYYVLHNQKINNECVCMLTGGIGLISLLKRDVYMVGPLVYIGFFIFILLAYLVFQLPITVLSVISIITFSISPFLYDKLNNTNQTFVSLPIKREMLVRERYVYGLLWIIGTTAIMAAVMTLASFFLEDVYVLSLEGAVFYAALLILFIALSLPHLFMYNFNISSFVVLAQMIFLFMAFFSVAYDWLFADAYRETENGFIVELTSRSIDKVFSGVNSDWSVWGVLAFFLASLLVLFLSYLLSVYAFKRKDVGKK